MHSAKLLIPLVALILVFGVVSGAALAQTNATVMPSVSVSAGTALLTETFDRQDAWEQYSNLMTGVELGVENGVYRASTFSGGYAWGLNAQVHTDVIMQVEATQMSIYPDSAFGVMCRANISNNGDGYYFMINANGYYSIRVGEGDNVFPLVEWTQSDAIHTNIDKNVIRAVCMGDYLALYVNDQLLAEVHDRTYTSGYAGLAVGAAAGSTADVAFDNLTIFEAISA